MEIQKDIREFIELLLLHEVEFLLVGGYALAFHGAPRFTEDIDFWIKNSEENAARMERVLAAFGFGDVGITRQDFLVPEQVIQLGRAPNRIDLLTSISGAEWEEAWSSRDKIELGGLSLHCLSREVMIQNKRASGRLQDLADAARLQQRVDPEIPEA